MVVVAGVGSAVMHVEWFRFGERKQPVVALTGECKVDRPRDPPTIRPLAGQMPPREKGYHTKTRDPRLPGGAARKRPVRLLIGGEIFEPLVNRILYTLGVARSEDFKGGATGGVPSAAASRSAGVVAVDGGTSRTGTASAANAEADTANIRICAATAFFMNPTTKKGKT
jgi:hypothetical protein